MGGAMYIDGSAYEISVGSGITFGSAGVSKFSGTADVHLLDNVRLNIGDGSDLAIYHNATNSAISISNGQLQINKGASENIAKFTPDGAVELYYDNSKKFETTTSGVTVTGSVTATNYLGDGSALTGVGGDTDITSCLFV